MIIDYVIAHRSGTCQIHFTVDAADDELARIELAVRCAGLGVEIYHGGEWVIQSTDVVKR